MAKRLRMKKGRTQEQLGAEMGFTGAAISAMERLIHPVSDDMLVQLERVLGGGNCVEVATAVHLRDSKVQDGPTFTVGPSSWSAFVAWQN
ncbi:DUF397 domain-containing protein [Streptomyces sp. P9-A4]|uniref:DUF397 domain-containing protein n=1 Tax=Streptomyces sp. P9-A4 TaxID=3072285 RepID=UPI002FCBD90B